MTSWPAISRRRSGSEAVAGQAGWPLPGGFGLIEIDAVELGPFAAITEADVRWANEPDRETLRDRAAHAGPIDDDTRVYRIELHAVSAED
jgi:hypothetical protein